MDHIVSVRMPHALFEKLSALATQQHYLDVSECLRSITRKRCLELTLPYSSELSAIRNEVSLAFSHKAESTRKEQLVRDLRKILGELEGGTR
jgi:hypothetical protein